MENQIEGSRIGIKERGSRIEDLRFFKIKICAEKNYFLNCFDQQSFYTASNLELKFPLELTFLDIRFHIRRVSFR